MTLRNKIQHVEDIAKEYDDSIPLRGAWRPEEEVIDELVERSGPFAYRSLVGLLAGTEMLEAENEVFTLQTSNWVDQFSDGAAIQDELLDVWKQDLIPPTSASGLFITLGFHPAWGIHIANARQKGERGGNEKLFPGDVFEAGNSLLTNTMAMLSRVLMEFQETAELDVESIRDELQEVYETAQAQLPDHDPSLPLFVDKPANEKGQWTIADFLYKDLIGEIGVGTGIITPDFYLEHVDDPGDVIQD